MDISAYFQMLSTDDRVLYFQLKDFWSDEAVPQFDTQFIALFNEAVDSMKGQAFFTFADLTELRSLSKSGEAAIAEVVKYARAHGLYKALETIPRDMSAMDGDEVEPYDEDDFRVMVTSIEEGWETINALKSQL